MPSFTRKNDFVCWVYLSQDQQRIYEEYACSEEVKEVWSLCKDNKSLGLGNFKTEQPDHFDDSVKKVY